MFAHQDSKCFLDYCSWINGHFHMAPRTPKPTLVTRVSTLHSFQQNPLFYGENFHAYHMSHRVCAKDQKFWLKCEEKDWIISILLPKLFWPTTVWKNCSSDWEKLLKFKAEGGEFSEISRSPEQFLVTECFLTCSWRFLWSNKLEQLEFNLESKFGI